MPLAQERFERREWRKEVEMVRRKLILMNEEPERKRWQVRSDEKAERGGRPTGATPGVRRCRQECQMSLPASWAWGVKEEVEGRGDDKRIEGNFASVTVTWRDYDGAEDVAMCVMSRTCATLPQDNVQDVSVQKEVSKRCCEGGGSVCFCAVVDVDVSFLIFVEVYRVVLCCILWSDFVAV